MKLLLKLLYLLHLHKWDETIDTRQCKRCHKKQKLLYAYPDDYNILNGLLFYLFNRFLTKHLSQ
jgi:hypothetical protein